MEFKTGIKVFLSMLLVSGTLTLASCGDTSKDGKNLSSEVVLVNPTSNIGTSSRTNTTTASSTSKNDGKSSITTSISGGEVIDDTIEKIGFETKIEKSYQDKINERLEENIVSDVDAKYFTIKDDATHGKSLEATGYVTFVDGDEVKPTTLAMPLTDNQYETLSALNDVDYIETNDLQQNYSKEQLSSVHDVVSAEDVTFSYAILDGKAWNLDALSPNKMEKALEQKYENLVSAYFLDVDGRDPIKSIDLKYVETIDNGYYGDTVRFVGTTTLQNDKVKSFEIKICPSSQNYQFVKDTIKSTASINKEMAENYTAEEMYCLYTVANDATTIQKIFAIAGAGYNLL